MSRELLERLRDQAEKPVTATVTSGFFPKEKKVEDSPINLTADSLIARECALSLIGKKIKRIEGNADDLRILLDDNGGTLFISNTGAGVFIKYSPPTPNIEPK